MADERTVLIDLDDTDLTVANPEEDIRGRPVIDRNGQEVGEVDGLMIDEDEQRVRFLEVGSGGVLGLGKKTRLIPVNAIESVDEAIRVDTTVQDVVDSPVYDPELMQEPSYLDFYDHYGVPPHWARGYLPPMWPPHA